MVALAQRSGEPLLRCRRSCAGEVMEQIVGDFVNERWPTCSTLPARVRPRRPKSPLSRARKKKHEPVDPYRH